MVRFRSGIAMSELSQTLQDAIRVTRKLGLQFIWIDALCIIQKEDDLRDFKEESIKMAYYYGNAYITIAAGSASSLRDGFLNLRTDTNPVPCDFDYSRPLRPDDGSYGQPVFTAGAVRACLSSSPEVGALLTRGWTFQEAVLSHRVIVYDQRQIMWNCHRLESREDGLVRLSRGMAYCSPYKWPKSIESMAEKRFNGDGASLSAIQEKSQLKKKLMRDWYNLLRQYTTRNIGNSDDRMTAMAGIAQKMAVYLDSRYIFGIWETDIIRGLLWRNGSGMSQILRSIPLRRTHRRVPSWSWACVDGSIHVENYERCDEKYMDVSNLRAEFLHAELASDNPWDPIRGANESFGLEPVSILLIKGILKPIQSSEAEFLQYSFKQPWLYTFWLPRRQKCSDVVTLLESAAPKEIKVAPRKVVGIAVFDIVADKTNQRDVLYCLRLTVTLGLLLVAVSRTSRGDIPHQASRDIAAAAPEDTIGSCSNKQCQEPQNAEVRYSRVGVVLVDRGRKMV
ncbi:MAG: hypothetical protein M1821_000603 [Bathelium mastoideum]|nr:MAG: hypothetical protein M1821_000603 [Bathelium mastoideum]